MINKPVQPQLAPPFMAQSETPQPVQPATAAPPPIQSAAVQARTIQTLEAALRAATDVAEKMRLLNRLASELKSVDVRRALSSAQEARQLYLSVATSGRDKSPAMRLQFARSLLLIGACYVQQQSYNLAQLTSEESLRIFEELKDKQGIADAMETVGSVLLAYSNYADALSTYQKSLRLYQELGDKRGEAASMHHIGLIYFAATDYAISLEFHQKAYKLRQSISDYRGMAASMLSLGAVYLQNNSMRNALSAFQKSFKIALEVRDPHGEISALKNLGAVYCKLGDMGKAVEFYQQALKICQDAADRYSEADVMYHLGKLHVSLGNHEYARGMLQRGQELSRDIENRHLEAQMFLQLGKLYLESPSLISRAFNGNKTSGVAVSIEHLNQALEIALDLDSKELQYTTHEALAASYKALGDYSSALEEFEKFHALKEEVFSEEMTRRSRTLQVLHHVEQARTEAELYRLKTVELAEAASELQLLNEHLRHTEAHQSDLLEKLEKQAVELDRQAKTDGLTGLYNRRHLDFVLTQEFDRARRYARPLTLAICDVDFFKKINDTFSHHIGDEVLRSVAEVFRMTCRSEDVLGRYGGEEFVIAFVETPLEKSLVACEKIRKALEGYEWGMIHEGLKVTISIGLCADLTQPNAEKMLSAADTKLYEAKHNGRNQVRY